MTSEESQEKASNSSPEHEEVASESSTTVPPTTTWQAIFAPQYNTYYFYNPVTQETTWINPLQQPQPEASTSSTTTATATSSSATETSVAETETETETETRVQNESEEEGTGAQETAAATASAASARYAALKEAALAQGIDPLLAHLDPSLLAPSVPGSSGGSSGMYGLSFLDLFNEYLIDLFLERRLVPFFFFISSLPPPPQPNRSPIIYSKIQLPNWSIHTRFRTSTRPSIRT